MKTSVRNKSGYRKKSKTRAWNGLPATVRQTLFEKSLHESFFVSIFWHLASFFILSLIIFLFNFFGLTPKIFPQPIKKVKDIEFNLSGSKYNRKRHSSISANSTSTTESLDNTQNDPQSTSNNINPQKTSQNNKSSVSLKQANNAPNFDMPMPSLKSMSSGLSSGGKKGQSHNTDNSSGSVPSIGDINDAFSSGGGSSSSGFDKNATRKIISTYDISPYVNELKQDIRWNWKQPKSIENKRVELFLRIARDGRLIILNVKRTSEIGEVDNAALNSVKKCLPLSPLPQKYPKNYLDIVFTFSSNSIGSRY